MKAFTVFGTLLLVVSACRAGSTTGAAAASPSVSRGGALGGTWRGSDGVLTVTLALAQSADSVSGTGTYTRTTADIGCGGETLPASGRMTFTGRLAHAGVAGWMRFDNGWMPPYLGTMAGADSIVGRFQSVDRGPCALTLVRRH